MPKVNFTDRLSGVSDTPSTWRELPQVLDKAWQGNVIFRVSILNSTHEIMEASQMVCLESKVV